NSLGLVRTWRVVSTRLARDFSCSHGEGERRPVSSRPPRSTRRTASALQRPHSLRPSIITKQSAHTIRRQLSQRVTSGTSGWFTQAMTSPVDKRTTAPSGPPRELVGESVAGEGGRAEGGRPRG